MRRPSSSHYPSSTSCCVASGRALHAVTFTNGLFYPLSRARFSCPRLASTRAVCRSGAHASCSHSCGGCSWWLWNFRRFTSFLLYFLVFTFAIRFRPAIKDYDKIFCYDDPEDYVRTVRVCNLSPALAALICLLFVSLLSAEADVLILLVPSCVRACVCVPGSCASFVRSVRALWFWVAFGTYG